VLRLKAGAAAAGGGARPGMRSRSQSGFVLTLALALISACASPAPAGQASSRELSNLTGNVSSDSGAPIENAVCTLTGSLLPSSGLTETTDRQGHFEFLQLAPGAYTLACAAMGYEPLVKQLELGRESPEVNFVLPARQTLRQSIEVRAHAPTAGLEQGAPPAAISSRQISALPLTEQKFKAALPLIPGVVRTPDGRINIKGLPENQGLLLLNGAENVDPVTGSFSIDVPLQAVESLQVSKNAYRADYGGFSGGLATIYTKPPLSQWHYEVQNITPNPRIEAGTIAGIENFNPRVYFTGPIVADRLSFSEAVAYDADKQPVRGLPWPHNEIRSHDFNSLTTFQYIFSPRHLTTLHANVFPLSREFADINSLVPQTASSNYGQSGYSIALTDRYLTSAGTAFTTIAEGTQFDSYGHGQGPEDMRVTPDGWAGNFFNSFTRDSSEEQIGETVALPALHGFGKHDLILGGSFIRRAFNGSSASRPVQILREDGTLAEQTGFTGPGRLAASDTEGAAYVQDHWTLTDQFAVDLGARAAGQTLGHPFNLAPRLGAVYSPGTAGKTVLRAGFGVFYSHVPLLVGGFTGNPERQVTYYDSTGVPRGPSLAFPNYFGNASNPQNPGLSLNPPNRTPYNISWSVEADQELLPDVTLRLSAVSSRTRDDFVVDPLTGLPTGAALVVSPTGDSAYHEFESTLHVRFSENAEWNLSYVASRARGDLNSLVQVYVPFEAPVIRPNVYATLPSDIPNRLITWGRFPTHLWGIEASPVIDWHSGFPYSYVDVDQNYVGVPNSHRFTRFFSLDLKLAKEFHLPLPLLKHHLLRGSLTVFNLTNHINPRDVYTNITSQYFNHQVGLQHRFFDSELDIVY
jgi:Carboxypeptidase regulatory-like domain